MGSESQPKPIDARKLAFLPTAPESGSVARRINGEQTIVGVTTLSLGSEEDPKVASYLEAVGEPNRVTTNNDSWESRRGIFHVYMVRDSIVTSDRGEPLLETTRVLLFSTKPNKTVYLALDDGKIHVEEKRAENEQRRKDAAVLAELEKLLKPSEEDK